MEKNLTSGSSATIVNLELFSTLSRLTALHVPAIGDLPVTISLE
jgi:hypothetical protein